MALCGTFVPPVAGGARHGSLDWETGAAQCARRRPPVAKGQEKPGKTNKPKVSTKDKQTKKAEKKAAAS